MSPYRPEPVGLLLPLDAPDTFEPAQDDQLARALAAYLSPALSATAFSLPTQADTLSLPKIPHTGSITSLRAADSFLPLKKAFNAPRKPPLGKSPLNQTDFSAACPLSFGMKTPSPPLGFSRSMHKP